MSDISKIQIESGIYDIKDTISRNEIEKLRYNNVVFMKVDESNGDCALIQTKNHNILIDTSDSHSYLSIKQTLQNHNVEKIDYCIISHYHGDHVNNLQNLMTDFDFTDCVFYLANQNIPNSVDNYATILEKINILNALITNNEKVFPEDNSTLNVDNIKITFYNNSDSDFAYYESLTNDYNDYSMCCNVECGDKCITFAADIGLTAQDHIYNSVTSYFKRSQVLKAEHHGYNNAINSDYILTISPDYTIITESISSLTNLSVTNPTDNYGSRYLQEMGSEIYCAGYNEIEFRFNETVVEPISNYVNIGAGYNWGSEYFKIYCDNTFTGKADGSKNRPFKTLNLALGYVAKLNNAMVEIECNNKTYTEDVNIVNLSSVIKLSNMTANRIKILNSNVYLNNCEFTSVTDIHVRAENSFLQIDNCSFVNALNLRCIALYNTIMKASTLTISNKQICLYLSNSFANITTLNGTNNDYLSNTMDNSKLTIQTNNCSYTKINQSGQVNQVIDEASNLMVINDQVNIDNLTPSVTQKYYKYYITNSASSNLPESINGFLTSYYISDNTKVQTYLCANTHMYVRNSQGGVWQSWKQYTIV